MKSFEQLNGTLEDLKIYLEANILPDQVLMSKKWVFVPMIACERIDDISFCSSCENHVIKGINFKRCIKD